jgi:hypothetical protein
MLSDRTLEFGEKLCSLTLGIDELYRSESAETGEKDALVVLNMGNIPALKLNDYREAREELAELARRAFSLPEPDRRLYYTQAALSLDAFCAERQGLLPELSAQIGFFLHVNPHPPTDEELDAYRKKLRDLLMTMGYIGDLRAQCAAWEEKNRVPPDEIEGVVNELMNEARERTGRILDLPSGDFYRCITERDCPFNAKSDYDNRTVVINISPILTRQALKHLVCHECYPGHFMQFSLRQRLYKKGEAAADCLLSVVNHSSSATFEGIADSGIEFIDWVLDGDDRVNAVLTELKAALGTRASYMLHREGLSASSVEEWLRKQALVGGEGWVSNRMRFIGKPSRSALIWSYWRGDLGVSSIWRRTEPSDHPRFFSFIYDRLHTVQSMRLFAELS